MRTKSSGLFRPEIQALRAVAVTMVVAYQWFPHRFPGGFVGVDVFFAISGFLITGHMIREAEATGRLSLISFWGNRMRRILPASLVTIIAITIVGIIVLPPSGFRRLAWQAVASVFYGENWILAGESVDYLAANAVATPFQHFWSLGVEEQFYLFWPLLVVLATWLTNRGRARWWRPRGLVPASEERRTLRTNAAVLFGLTGLISFGWCCWQVFHHDPAAYFVTTARIWELAAGALLALIADRVKIPAKIRLGLLALSVLASILCVFLIEPDMPFPGPLALVPVGIAASMILAGPVPPGPGRTVNVLLNWRPIQWLGNTSYSLYLWHFPVITFFILLQGRAPGKREGLGLLVLAVGLAAVSYYLVENPIRFSAKLKRMPMRTIAFGGVGMLMVAAIGLTPLGRARAFEATWQGHEIATGLGQPWGAPAMAVGLDDPSFLDPGAGIVPNPATKLVLQTVPGKEYTDCQGPSLAAETPTCDWKPAKPVATVALVGDSNAHQYIVPLLEVATAEHWRVTTYLHSSCPFSDEESKYQDENAGKCREANQKTMQALLEVKPDLVITSSSFNAGFVDMHTGHRPGVKGTADLWHRLMTAGIPVLTIRPNPRVGNVNDCVTKHMSGPEKCAVRRTKAFDKEEQAVFAEAVTQADGVTELDLWDDLCGKKKCYAVIGNVLVYYDGFHLNSAFAKSLAQRLRTAIIKAMTQ